MTAHWTKQQESAISLWDGNILVSAAAGSGKTAVLVERIFSRLTDASDPIDVDQILAVTFTKAAAAEMKERVQERLLEALEEDPQNELYTRQLAEMSTAQIMTIDSFCLQVVRNHFQEIDLDPAFRVGEETELKLLQEDIANRVIEDRYEAQEEAFLQFADCFAKGKLDEGMEDLILRVYRASRSYLSPAKWLADCLQSFRLEAGDSLDDWKTMEYLKNYVQDVVTELKLLTEKGLSLCQAEGGPAYYRAALQADRDLLESLSQAQTFDQYQDLFSHLHFKALGRASKNMPKSSEEKEKEVKTLREEVKGELKNLAKRYFSLDRETVISQMNRMRPQMEMLVDLVEDFSARFQEAKEKKNLVDFGDLEHFALQILTRQLKDEEAEEIAKDEFLLTGKEEGFYIPSDTAIEISKQYVEILIDEYQDSNELQEIILKSISREREGKPNLFMVGDVKQSIYKFRQARPELFLEKYRTYPRYEGEKKPGQKNQKIELNRNFRSHRSVLDGVNLIFRRIMTKDLGGIDYDDDAALYPGSEEGENRHQDTCLGSQDVGRAHATAYFETDAVSVGEESGNSSDCCEMLLAVSENLLETDAVRQEESNTTVQEEMDAAQQRGSGAAAQEKNAAAQQKESAAGLWTDVEFEAHVVAKRIQELVQGPHPFCITEKETGNRRPVQYGDITILLRAGKGWLDPFVRVLEEEQIPVHAKTTTGFFSSLEIRRVLAYIRTIDNPRQDIPLASSLKPPMGSMTDEELAMISSVFGGGKGKTLYDCCMEFMQEDATEAGRGIFEQEAVEQAQRKLCFFFRTLDTFRARVPYTSTHELLLQIYEETGCYLSVSAMPGGKKRKANLDMLVAKATDYEKTSYRGLFHFLRYIDQLQTYEEDFGEAAEGEGYENSVSVMTIHGSKGLEYPVVFVAGMEKNFNQRDTREEILLDRDFGFGPNVIDPKKRFRSSTLQKNVIAEKLTLENLAEEQRILYVAMTRAREKLILVGCVNQDGSKNKKGLQEKLFSWGQAEPGEQEHLSFRRRSAAENDLDWLMPVLLRQSGADRIRKEYGLILPDTFDPEHTAHFLIREIKTEEVRTHVVRQSIAATQEREDLLHFDLTKEYQPEMHQTISGYFDWSYPYEEERGLHTKLTVSEIKTLRQQQEFEEEKEESAYLYDARKQELDLNQPLDRVEQMTTSDKVEQTNASDQEEQTTAMVQAKLTTAGEVQAEAHKGAENPATLRGITIHRILEYLDFEKVWTRSDLEEFIRTKEQEGILDKEGISLIYKPALLKFLQSPLASRMRAAAGRGQLYREKQFFIGVPPSTLDPSVHADDLVLIQGVIDAWFVEEGEIVLVDYKSDYVADDGADLIWKYHAQLDYYALALEQITGKKVKEKILYSFGLGKALQV